MIDTICCTDSFSSETINKEQNNEQNNMKSSSSSTTTTPTLLITLKTPISVTENTPTLLCNLQSLQTYPTLSPEAATTFINVGWIIFHTIKMSYINKRIKRIKGS